MATLLHREVFVPCSSTKVPPELNTVDVYIIVIVESETIIYIYIYIYITKKLVYTTCRAHRYKLFIIYSTPFNIVDLE